MNISVLLETRGQCMLIAVGILIPSGAMELTPAALILSISLSWSLRSIRHWKLLDAISCYSRSFKSMQFTVSKCQITFFFP